MCVRGDEVNIEDSLVVLESDKATMEVPSTAKGKVTRILLGLDEKVGEVPILELEVQDMPVASGDRATKAPPIVSPQVSTGAKVSTPIEGAKQKLVQASVPPLDSERKVHAGLRYASLPGNLA